MGCCTRNVFWFITFRPVTIERTPTPREVPELGTIYRAWKATAWSGRPAFKLAFTVLWGVLHRYSRGRNLMGFLLVFLFSQSVCSSMQVFKV